MIFSSWHSFLSVLDYLSQLFLGWIYIFWSPFTHFYVLWIIIPIWLSWFFSEFFQEKQGTSFGNAISNGVVPFWVALDWARLIVTQLQNGALTFGTLVLLKLVVCSLVCIFGLTIIIQGIRGKRMVLYIGGITKITYVLVMATPVMYGIIDLTWHYLLQVILFYPLFYFLIKAMDHFIPDPAIVELDSGSPKANYTSITKK